ncbi:MAG: cyclic nucleotide-binding domain-containing protein [Hyphomicrobiales bacterium]|nr:cyclic nucleotide-binding domain-containing protein [Hyphomicrobiales bacterium]
MPLDRDLEILSGVAFFEGVSQEALKLIAFSADQRDFADKERVFSAGDHAEGGLVVIEGRIDLLDERLKPPRVAERLGPGSLIGEMALIVETRRPLSAVSVGGARTLSVRRALFRRMLEGYPDIARLLEARIAERLTKLSPQIRRIGETLAGLDEA